MLYTVILEFDGLSSVSQFRASGPEGTLRRWAAGLQTLNKYGLSKPQAKSVARAIAVARQLHSAVNDALGVDEEELTPLRGMKNVWCMTASTSKKKFVLLNIVATVS